MSLTRTTKYFLPILLIQILIQKQINYYDDMKITKDNLQEFLCQKLQIQIEKNYSISRRNYFGLTDTSLLNEYYNFVSEEFPDDILDEGSSYLSSSEINEFKYEVLEGIIDIIFHVGTSFYVSNVSSKSTTNKVTTRGFSSYEISNIDDIIIISHTMIHHLTMKGLLKTIL